MGKLLLRKIKHISISTLFVDTLACIYSSLHADEQRRLLEQEMAADLRKDKPGMKGATIRKRVGAAWSEHFLSFTLSYLELSAEVLRNPQRRRRQRKPTERLSEGTEENSLGFVFRSFWVFIFVLFVQFVLCTIPFHPSIPLCVANTDSFACFSCVCSNREIARDRK